MQIQSEIIYPESIMAHLISFKFCPVFDKRRAKVRLCVCIGVLVMVTYGHDRFFVTVTSHMDVIHDVTKWAVHLCFRIRMGSIDTYQYLSITGPAVSMLIDTPHHYHKLRGRRASLCPRSPTRYPPPHSWEKYSASSLFFNRFWFWKPHFTQKNAPVRRLPPFFQIWMGLLKNLHNILFIIFISIIFGTNAPKFYRFPE